MLPYCHYAIASDSALQTAEIDIKAQRSVTSHESHNISLLTSNTYKSAFVNSSAWPPGMSTTFRNGDFSERSHQH
jgi:hypothetical protein